MTTATTMTKDVKVIYFVTVFFVYISCNISDISYSLGR